MLLDMDSLDEQIQRILKERPIEGVLIIGDYELDVWELQLAFKQFMLDYMLHGRSTRVANLEEIKLCCGLS